MDLVQDTLVEVLRDGPRFTLSDEGDFRALLARIVENSIRDRCDHFAAKKRAAVKETSLPDDSMLDLDPPRASVTRPSEAVMRHEAASLVQLALKLLDQRDREIIVLRQQEELSFAAAGERLSIPEDTARFRFQRALPRLARRIEELRSGRLRQALGD